MYQTKTVLGSGPIDPDLMVVGEAPGEVEEAEGEVLVGPTGKEVASYLLHAGSNLSQCWKTNVSKWRPPENKFKRLHETGHDLQECIELLRKEERDVRPKAILALGDEALGALCLKDGIMKWRGSILTSVQGTKVIPTIHPAAIHHRKPDGSPGLPYFYKRIIELDFKRAVEESKYKEYNPPRRTLEVITNPTQLLRFFSQYSNRRRWSVDLETIHGIPSCVGLAPSKSHAVSIPLFNPFDWGEGKKLQDFVLAQFWDILAKFFENSYEWIGQNFKFDHEKIRTVLRWRIQNNIYLDTGLSAHILQPEFPKSLQFNTSIKTREPYYKDELKEFNPQLHKSEQIYIYNARDAAVTFEIAEVDEALLRARNLWQFYNDFPNRMYEIYLEMDSIGFRINEEKRKALYDKYAAWVARNNAELEVFAGFPVNVQSPKDVPIVLEKFGFPKRLKETGNPDNAEATLVALEGNHAKSEDARRVIKLILETRRLRKTVSTYIDSPPDFDGRMRTIYNIAGTETGRSSTSKLDSPVRPFKGKGSGWAFQTLTKHGEIGPDIREMCIPDEGMEFGQADLSQAELYVVAHLSDDFELLDLLKRTRIDKSKGDVHDITAQRILGVKGIANGEERFLTKKVRYGGSYGMEKRKLMSEINSNAYKYDIPVRVSEFRAGKLLQGFHDFTPKIRGVYHPVIQSTLSSNNRILFNAYGRPRQFHARWDSDLFREAYAYIPSSTVHDHIARAVLNIKGTTGHDGKAPWITFIVDAHDAFLCQYPIERRAEFAAVMREEFETPISFSKCSLPKGELIIPCDIEVGMDYKNLKKIKVA